MRAVSPHRRGRFGGSGVRHANRAALFGICGRFDACGVKPRGGEWQPSTLSSRQAVLSSVKQC
jgi:hypothetical protein